MLGMDLRTFLFSLPTEEREGFAVRVGTTAKHLTNVAYGYRPCAPDVAVSIERETKCAVTRRDLRPNDCEAIWPDLSAHPKEAS